MTNSATLTQNSSPGTSARRGLGPNLVLMLITTLTFIGFGAPVFAAPQLAETVDTCLSYSLRNKALRKDLQKIGWRDLGKADLADASKVFHDGLMLVENSNPRQKIDFKAADNKASGLVRQMWRLVGAEESSGVFYFSGGDKAAVLMVSTGFEAGRSWLQCTYAGPDDLYVQQILKVTGAQDARAGVKQPSKTYQRGLLQGRNGLVIFSLLAGKYLPGIAAEIGQKPASAVGVSTISAAPWNIALPTPASAAPQWSATVDLCLAPFETAKTLVARATKLGWQSVEPKSMTEAMIDKAAEIDLARKLAYTIGEVDTPKPIWKQSWELAQRNAQGLQRLVETPKSTPLRRYFTDPASDSLLTIMINNSPYDKWLNCGIGATKPLAKPLMPTLEKVFGRPSARFAPMTGLPGKFPNIAGVIRNLMVVAFNPAKIEPLIGTKPQLSVVILVFSKHDSR